MSKRGFRTAGEASLVREMVSRGWKRLERNGAGHIRLLYPPTEFTTQIPSSMDDGFRRAIYRRLLRAEKK